MHKVTDRVEEERRLWEAIPHVSDLTQSEEHAQEHDAGMQGTVLLGGLLETIKPEMQSTPMRLGGLGLRSAQRCTGCVLGILG